MEWRCGVQCRRMVGHVDGGAEEEDRRTVGVTLEWPVDGL